MPQMGPMPWVFLFLGVLCLVFSYLVILYFFMPTYKYVKKQPMLNYYYWAW